MLVGENLGRAAGERVGRRSASWSEMEPLRSSIGAVNVTLNQKLRAVSDQTLSPWRSADRMARRKRAGQLVRANVQAMVTPRGPMTVRVSDTISLGVRVGSAPPKHRPLLARAGAAKRTQSSHAAPNAAQLARPTEPSVTSRAITLITAVRSQTLHEHEYADTESRARQCGEHHHQKRFGNQDTTPATDTAATTTGDRPDQDPSAPIRR